MTDTTTPPPDEWLTYTQAAQRLGLRTSEAAAARARRGKWPKRIRNTDGTAEVLVPGAMLTEVRKAVPDRIEPTLPPTEPPALVEALQVALSPLVAALDQERATVSALRAELDQAHREREGLSVKVAGLEGQVHQARHEAVISAGQAAQLREGLDRETQDRRTLQGQADQLRADLGAAQLEAATASGEAKAEAARREAAEAQARDLQTRLDQLQARPRRRWWPFG